MAASYSCSLSALSLINSKYYLDLKSDIPVIYVDGITLTKINQLFRSAMRKENVDLRELVEMFKEHLFTKYFYNASVEYSYKEINIERLTLRKNLMRNPYV